MQKIVKPIAILCLIGLLSHSLIAMAQPLDKSAIKAIDLKIAPLPQAKLTAADINSLRTIIIANLSQYRFPLKPESGQTYSHTLMVNVGESKSDQTPVGISFSVGNADPRAPKFQKADVIPVQCRLIDNANPKQEELLEMTFSAPSANATSQQLQETLTDHISSVCFDLLDSLKFLPPPTAAQAAASTSKPSWIPSIQVETVTVPVIQPQPQPKVESAPAAVLPAPKAITTEKPQTTQPTPTPAAPATAVATPVTPAKPEPEEETRKQLIIHNQGTPVIIKFGYDRQ